MPSNNAKPNIAVEKLRTVVFVVYPGVKLLDLAGPLQAFSDATDAAGKLAYRTVVASSGGGSVASDTPVSLETEALGTWRRRRIDTLIVVGGTGRLKACQDPHLLEYVRQLSGKSRRTGSVCTGAFILAACGLLHERDATTHWESCSELAATYPTIRVESDPIFVRDDDVWTSAGVTAGIDMAIAMIADDLGRPASLSLARQLVAYLVRPGGQSQFSEALHYQIADGAGRFDRLHQWIHTQLDRDLSVERLAEQASMSPRHFIRAYKAHTGQTPAKAVEGMRVEAARRMLESEVAAVQVIAARCGFGNDERMRRAFLRRLNVPPSDYRSRFQ